MRLCENYWGKNGDFTVGFLWKWEMHSIVEKLRLGWAQCQGVKRIKPDHPNHLSKWAVYCSVCIAPWSNFTNNLCFYTDIAPCLPYSFISKRRNVFTLHNFHLDKEKISRDCWWLLHLNNYRWFLSSNYFYPNFHERFNYLLTCDRSSSSCPTEGTIKSLRRGSCWFSVATGCRWWSSCWSHQVPKTVVPFSGYWPFIITPPTGGTTELHSWWEFFS